MSTTPDPQHPHDSFFKQTFGQPEVARDFLRNYLPAPVVAHLQLDSLEDQRESFVDPDLQEHFSDLLYRVLLDGGGTAYVYVLLEHKSYPDRYDPQLRVHLPRVFQLVYALSRQQSGLQYLYTFLRYVMSAGERVGRDELRQMVEALFSRAGDVIMGTIAQELREEGIEQGRQEGAQALCNGILAVLRLRFALSEQDVEAAAHKLAQVADLRRLEVLHLQALQDPTFEDYLRHLEQG